MELNVKYHLKNGLNNLKRNKMKKETIEEAADKFSKELSQVVAFYEGAKWQQERMYSEEEVLDILFKHTEYFNGYGKRMTLTEWFEQFKKK